MFLKSRSGDTESTSRSTSREDSMRVVILAGGLGTRLAQEAELAPKPMVEIGGHPILWHITKHFAHHGFTEFALALGYKSEVIKRYFFDYQSLSGSMTIDLAKGSIARHDNCEDWIVHLIETGKETNTGGPIKRLQSLLSGEPFILTYCAALSTVHLSNLLAFHL